VTRLPFSQASFTEFIGARVEQVDEGVCRLSLTVTPDHLDARGVLHTGVLTSLMDATIGIGLGYLRRDEVRHRPHATIEMNASFLAEAATGDEIEVEGRVIRQGRSIAFGESVARRRPHGDTLALSRLTFAIAAHPHPQHRTAHPDHHTAHLDDQTAHPEVSKDESNTGHGPA
jgi:uncharacterized protein (TIGR00369 family)